MHLNSQRLPVTQHRLHSKVIFPLVINYYTLSSDANLGCLWLKQQFDDLTEHNSKYYSEKGNN